MCVGGRLVVLGHMCPSFAYKELLESKEGMIYHKNEHGKKEWKKLEQGPTVIVETPFARVKLYNGSSLSKGQELPQFKILISVGMF